MSRNITDAELQCDICFVEFDINHHRPKSLPCGHSVCSACVQNPAMEKKCPSCRKEMTVDPGDLPDNISLLRVVEKEKEYAPPPCKVPKTESTEVQQLQRGVDAGRKLVEQLRQLVPLAVAALNRQLDSCVAQLSLMEETLDKLQNGARRGSASQDAIGEQFQLVVRLEDSLRLLTTNKCRVDAEVGAATWTASVQPGPADHVLRLLLLQLRAGGQLQKVAVDVGPPSLSTYRLKYEDALNVNDILQNPRRWRNVRVLEDVCGPDSKNVLRVIRAAAPRLEELEISPNEEDLDGVLEEVAKMTSLKKLIMHNDGSGSPGFPGLPLQLEELSLCFPNEQQMRCVHRMPRLRSLVVLDYVGKEVSFPPSQHEGLLSLGLCLNVDHKTTMLTLIRAHAKSLKELLINCEYDDSEDHDDRCYFFPNLGQDLATCGLHGLGRLVLERSYGCQCPEVDACLLQLRAVQSFLPSSVEVLCKECSKPQLPAKGKA